MVGSRRATAYGRQVAHLLAEALGRAGVVVVSGMARGVDAAAHEGPWRVVAKPGRCGELVPTGSILPNTDGSPKRSRPWRTPDRVPAGTPPRKHHFPERNRLLAGVADAVVVVEAAARSGALVTARLAVDEGREVFAVPGAYFPICRSARTPYCDSVHDRCSIRTMFCGC